MRNRGRHRHPHDVHSAAGGFRPDIEGLRALAVVLVVLDHLGAYPHGGFIGVDVFFVISGFLITGLLVKESVLTGRIAYLDFYRRRVRRILPAALTVLAVTWFVADGVLRGARVAETHSDVLWALFFSANIHFAHIGTDYFQANRPPSPVQHYWSLAVEEQFYLVWPIVLLAVSAATRGRRNALRNVLLVIAALVVAGSFAWGVHNTHVSPAAAYFSTFTRAWELGVGALLAVVLSRWPAVTGRLGGLRGPILGAGVAGIVLSAFLVNSDSGFPTPAAAFPVAATALVILGGAGLGPSRWSAVLTNPVAGYLGRISFSLYLWHYPVIVFVDALIAHRGVRWYVMVLGAMAALSVVSYTFVETPLRRPGAWRSLTEFSAARIRTACFATVLALVALLSYDTRPSPPIPPSSLVGASTSALPAYIARPSAALSSSIDAALQARSFPTLDPPLGKLDAGSEHAQWQPCETGTTLLASCTFHDPTKPVDPTKVAVVIGDSISLSWLPTIENALVPAGWTVYGLALQQCPATDVPTEKISDGTSQGAAACSSHQAFALAESQRLPPQLVFLSSSTPTTAQFADHPQGAAAAVAEYERGMVKTDTALAAQGRRVVTLAPPPTTHGLPGCDTAGSAPLDCVGHVQAAWFEQSAADKTAAAATGTLYLDTRFWFCSTANACPAFVGTTPVTYDGEHLTEKYATSLAPQLNAGLARLTQG